MSNFEELESTRDELVEAFRKYLEVRGHADDDLYPAEMMVSCRMSSISDRGERYRAVGVLGTWAGFVGLARYAEAFALSQMTAPIEE